MYQLEVKRYLVEHLFPPRDGWSVAVAVDGMEMGRSDQPDKQERARIARAWLEERQVRIGPHADFDRSVDLVAQKPGAATVVVEVEGDSATQPEQALYSALGQVVLLMKGDQELRYAVAVLDTSWQRQLEKIPARVCDQLSLTLWLVGENGVRELGTVREWRTVTQP